VDKNRTRTGHILAAITVAVWGMTMISTKVLLRTFEPIEILFLRFSMAYVILCLMSLKNIKSFKIKSIKDEAFFALAGICGVTLYFLLENTAINFTQASNVSVLVSVAPFFTAILSRIILKDEKPRAAFYAGFVIAIAGIVLIGANGKFVLKLSPVGDVLAIGAALSWAAYSILIRRMSGSEYSVVEWTRKAFFYGVLFMIPLFPALGFDMTFKEVIMPVNIVNILFLGAIGSAVCHVTWNTAIRYIGAVKTSSYIYAVPIITSIAAAAILKEKITVFAVLGIAMILAGLYLSQRTPGKEEEPEKGGKRA